LCICHTYGNEQGEKGAITSNPYLSVIKKVIDEWADLATISPDGMYDGMMDFVEQTNQRGKRISARLFGLF
jgi:hypothetical protein